LHVYLLHGGTKIDVIGMQPEQEYLAKTTAEWSKPLDSAAIEALDCSRDDLFMPFPLMDEDEKGTRNVWDLYLDSEFVQACRARARKIITQKCDLYEPGRRRR
jgi:hypothetical protein